MSEAVKTITETIGRHTIDLRVVSVFTFAREMIMAVGEVKYFYKEYTTGVIGTVKLKKGITYDSNNHAEILSNFYTVMDILFNEKIHEELEKGSQEIKEFSFE